MLLAARWRQGLKRKPKLIAVTVDHGLRAASKGEAAMVKRQAKALGLEHHTLPWRGAKPATGLQQAARAVRYRLLAEAAEKAEAAAILTAHTLDDQAETVLIRLSRGSGTHWVGGDAERECCSGRRAASPPAPAARYPEGAAGGDPQSRQSRLRRRSV